MKFAQLINILESQDNIKVKREYWDKAKTKPMFESWFKDGKRHRLDGPATQSWYENGQKSCETWYKDGKRHRLDGPTFQEWRINGQKELESWFKDGKRHRLDGPAYQSWYQSDQREYEEWWINGVEYTKKEFEEYIKGLDNKEDKEMISDLGQSFD